MPEERVECALCRDAVNAPERWQATSQQARPEQGKP